MFNQFPRANVFALYKASGRVKVKESHAQHIHINLTSRTNNFLMHFLLRFSSLFFANSFRETFAMWREVLDAEELRMPNEEIP